MNGVLIHAPDEYTRDMIKAALMDHLPLIVTQDRLQCLDALKQKIMPDKAFVAVCADDGNMDLGLFEEIFALRPGLKVIAVGDHDTEDMAAQAVRHGAAGYILMPAEANAILTIARARP